MKKVRKRGDKPAALDHVLYEILMLAHSLSALHRPGMAGSQDGSGWLESFAIHARNLNEFFAKEPEKNGYMKPHHFVADWTYNYIFDRTIQIRTSEQIAHLTYNRETPEEKTGWPLKAIFTALSQPALAFLNAVKTIDPLMAYHRNNRLTEALINGLIKLQAQLS